MRISWVRMIQELEILIKKCVVFCNNHKKLVVLCDIHKKNIRLCWNKYF